MLVTGAGGFIGSHLVEYLVSEGARVRAFVRYNSRSDFGRLEDVAQSVRDEVEVFLGDLTNSEAALGAVRGMDAVLHLGALIPIPYSYVHPREFVDVNVTGTLNILEAARQHDVKRLVQVSSSEVYGSAQTVPIHESHPLHPQSPYAATKVGADQLALTYWRSFETPVVLVRPFNTFGPRQSARAVIPSIISQALDRGVVRIGSTETTRDFLYVKDTARGIAACATNGPLGETLNLGTGEEHRIGDVARTIFRLLDREIELVGDDARLARPRARSSVSWQMQRSRARASAGRPPTRSKRGSPRRSTGSEGRSRATRPTGTWSNRPLPQKGVVALAGGCRREDHAPPHGHLSSLQCRASAGRCDVLRHEARVLLQVLERRPSQPLAPVPRRRTGPRARIGGWLVRTSRASQPPRSEIRAVLGIRGKRPARACVRLRLLAGDTVRGGMVRCLHVAARTRQVALHAWAPAGKRVVPEVAVRYFGTERHVAIMLAYVRIQTAARTTKPSRTGSPTVSAHGGTSFWSDPVPASASADPNSPAMINLLQQGGQQGFVIAAQKWSVAVYHADQTTPKHTVTLTASWAPKHQFTGIPIPTDATPSPDGDGHLAIIDPTTDGGGVELVTDMLAALARRAERDHAAESRFPGRMSPEALPAWSEPFAAGQRKALARVSPFASFDRQAAWGGSDGSGVTVAVIDSGVEAGHPRSWWPARPERHGRVRR